MRGRVVRPRTFLSQSPPCCVGRLGCAATACPGTQSKGLTRAGIACIARNFECTPTHNNCALRNPANFLLCVLCLQALSLVRACYVSSGSCELLSGAPLPTTLSPSLKLPPTLPSSRSSL